MSRPLGRLAAALLLALVALAPVAARAQLSNASVVASCASATYPSGVTRAITQDTTGQLCTAAPSGGAVTVTNPFDLEATQLSVLSAVNALVAAAANPAGILGTNGTTIASPTNGLDVIARGAAASGAAVSGNPLLDGGRASTTAPTAVADGQAVATRLSKLGNVVTSTWAPRDLQADNGGYTASATTSAVDCVTAGASGIFRDIISITANNSSATDTVIQILDTDGTTVRWTGTAKANDMRGIAFPQPLKEVAAAASWKCKTVTSVSSVVFTIQYFETK